VQQAWLAEDVPQCGYCQSGQIMAATAFLKGNPHPSDADIDTGITNICRCGAYSRIRAAIHRAAALMKA
jgi:isoquinoline 1-oxidoreductase alpha subunit